jgi:hypothetical protein
VTQRRSPDDAIEREPAGEQRRQYNGEGRIDDRFAKWNRRGQRERERKREGAAHARYANHADPFPPNGTRAEEARDREAGDRDAR